ncbi:MAG: SCP2 sterol-binding domain-containing protein [Lachnospiraceae bacterium]|nr:SCP2 sterol-binding domain-containing protein [Lachnospiraceae bacterium]
MRYEEVVKCVKEAFKDADVNSVSEHIAVQINITGEGEGAFYVEISQGKVFVEPYDYCDRDGLITASADTIIAVAKGEITIDEAISNETLRAEGNMDKMRVVAGINPPKPEEAIKEPEEKSCEEEKAEEPAKACEDTKAEAVEEEVSSVKSRLLAKKKKMSPHQAKAEKKKHKRGR